MIGKTISHYRILEKLGEGGMGVVYKAEDTKLERTVALKFLSPNTLASDEEKIRFVREAKAAAVLDHPNICAVYEIDETEGQIFISMAYVDGQSLEEKIEAGSLNPDEALDIAIQIAEGLQEAHDQGIVHRDVKSANIIISRRGQARILDFGLAKLAGKTRLTKTATIMGTVAYMSPEQAHGKTSIDHRTDIWSLGVVLSEMLTGKLPFDAPTDAGLIHKIIYEDPEPITNHRSDVPPALENAIKKMMQKDPQDRDDDMKAVIADLKAVSPVCVPSTSVMQIPVPSIAVLPFVDMSPQKDQEYFCDGLAEELISALTQLEDLRVIARTSAFAFKGEKADIRDIGKKLSVRSVLEGSVRKAGNKLRVTAQLVDTAGGHHLWSEQYDRELDDVFAIQAEITLAIVDKLKIKLLGDEKPKLATHKTVNLEAYHLYLKGRFFWSRQTGEGLKKAIAYFQQAIEKGPDYAPAYAGLARSYSELPNYGVLRPDEAFPKAREAAAKALQIDNTLARARLSLAYIKAIYDWDWEGAEREYQRAIQLNPSYANVHLRYSQCLTYMARIDEAIKEIKSALELDPISLLTNKIVGWVFNFARQYDQAIEILKNAIEMDPDFRGLHFQLGKAFLGKAMYQEAIAKFRESESRSGGWNPHAESYIGIAYAQMGNRDEAQRILNDLLRRSKEIYVPPFMLARLYFGLGEDDRGFEWLDRAYEKHDTMLASVKVHPVLDAVRSDPRYIALLKKMNLEP